MKWRIKQVVILSIFIISILFCNLLFAGRYYDAATGRFLTVDPNAVKYPSISPYSYSFNNPLNFVDPDGKDAIPIVFKDYLISAFGTKLPHLGHAGILLVDNQTGYTKYYEYGRYDERRMGIVNSYSVPNVIMDEATGLPTAKSLEMVLNRISQRSGQGGMITGAYIQNDNFKEMMEYAENLRSQNSDPKRKPYSIWTNNCGHFMKNVLSSGGANSSSMIDPRPNSYIDELRGLYPNLQYSITDSGVTYTVENHDQALDIANRYHSAGYRVMIDGVEYNP